MAALRAHPPAPAPSEQESVGALVSRLGTDISRIVRAEIALLQVRISSAITGARNAGIAVAAGVVLGLVGLGVFMFGFVFLLARVMPLWGAAFAVGGGLIVLSAVLVAVEAKRLASGVTEAFTDEGLRHGE